MKTVSYGNLLLIAKVIRPHGVKGLLKIFSYAQSTQAFFDAGSVFLKCPEGELREYSVLSITPYKNTALMMLEGLNSLEEAEKYRDCEILIEKDSLHRESDEEYFWYELIGLSVFLKTGECIGVIKNILSSGGNDNFVVLRDNKELFIPATREVVEEIDLDNKKMIISEIKGLLELNEV